MKTSISVATVSFVILLLLSSHAVVNNTDDDDPLPPSSDFIQISDDYIELSQNQSFTLYIQFFNPDNISQPLDITGMSIKITVWEITTNTSTVVEKRTMSFHDEQWNDTSYRLYRDSFYAEDPGLKEMQIEIEADTFTAYSYFQFDLIETFVPPPIINFIHDSPNITYSPYHPLEFIIDDDIPIREFSVWFNDTMLVSFRSVLGDGETDAITVKENGSYIHFKEFSLDSYAATEMTGTANITIQAVNLYYTSNTVSTFVNFDGEGPNATILTSPDEIRDNDQYYYKLNEGGKVVIEIDAFDPAGVDHFIVKVGDKTFTTNSSTIEIKDDGSFSAYYTGYSITAVDTLGNSRRILRGNIIYVTQSSDTNAAKLPLMVAGVISMIMLQVQLRNRKHVTQLR